MVAVLFLKYIYAMSNLPAKAAPKRTRAPRKQKRADPRQITFFVGYTDPESPTYSNAYQSAIAAGYSETYAKNITSRIPDRVAEIVRSELRVKKWEHHFDEVLEMPIITQAMGAFGPLFDHIPTGEFEDIFNKKTKKIERKEVMRKEPIMTYNTSRIKEKTKAGEVILSALKPSVYGKKSSPTQAIQINFGGMKDKYAS